MGAHRVLERLSVAHLGEFAECDHVGDAFAAEFARAARERQVMAAVVASGQFRAKARAKHPVGRGARCDDACRA